MAQLIVNGRAQCTTVSGDKPLLWLLREYLAMTGPKFGCGIGEVGLPPLAPALANALARLNGKRLRTLPFPANMGQPTSPPAAHGPLLAQPGSRA